MYMLSPDNGKITAEPSGVFQAKIDTGTTFTASGRPELFPKELTQHWNPDLRVLGSEQLAHGRRTHWRHGY
tara:strand:- start:960 stop:1172 length:213 start_codon:yes stop_codon:yes gene_type:complete